MTSVLHEVSVRIKIIVRRTILFEILLPALRIFLIFCLKLPIFLMLGLFVQVRNIYCVAVPHCGADLRRFLPRLRAVVYPRPFFLEVRP